MVDKIKNDYLMEHPDEAVRLDIKTDPGAVREQALLCGISPGARVLDVGCGSGRTSSILHEIVGPCGEVIGVDYSESRLDYARQHFGGKPGISFHFADFTRPMEDLGQFDYIWVRFVLEYFLNEAKDIVINLTDNLKPNGRLCLLDLDHNSLNHYPLPEEMEEKLYAAFVSSAEQFNFDPYAGRKLYSYLYDQKYRDIRVEIVAHHLIYGELRPQDEYNWTRKFFVSASKYQNVFIDYPGEINGFFRDFHRIFSDPRRFTYTPMIICSGTKPAEQIE